MKNPSVNEFHLKQVKYLKSNASVEITARYDSHQEDSMVYPVSLKATVGIEPHPDFKQCLEELKPMLASIHGLLDVKALVNRKEFKGNKEQKEFAEKHTDVKLSAVNITGISISGEEGSRGVIITGTYDGMSINTRRVLFTEDGSLGFETELEAICDNLIDETYEYYFNGKKSKEQTLFDAKSDDMENELEVSDELDNTLGHDAIMQAAKKEDESEEEPVAEIG